MFEDLIKYEDLQEACAELFGFCGVTFMKDFGPWKQGDKVDSMWFKLDGDAVAEEQSNDGKVIKSCKFKLEAIG